MHRNPLKRGLVDSANSCRSSALYTFGEVGLVRLNETELTNMQVRRPAVGMLPSPALAKNQRTGQRQLTFHAG